MKKTTRMEEEQMAASSILLEIQDTVEAYARIMSRVAQIEVEVVDELPDTARGQGGIGSTGR